MAKKKNNPKETTNAASNSPMNLNLLEQITRLMKENDLNTVDVRDGDKRVILKRGAAIAPMAAMPMTGPLGGFANQYASATPTSSNAPASSSAAPPADDTANMLSIKSPMVGTFYASSSPDSKAFVSVGSTVDEDTDVCIIEAMKVFNNIKAECKGTIAKIMVENGATVEFGQVLFLVKP